MKKILTAAVIMCAALNILAQQQVHTLADGESLRTVAEKYGVTLEELKAANPNLGKVLRTGMSVNIPQKQVVAAPVVEEVVEETQYKTYKVGRGDTYAKVAKQYGVSVEDLKAANPKYKKYLVAGSTLQIPVKVKATKPVAKTQSAVSTSATSAAASAPASKTVAATTTTTTTGSTGDALRDLELQKAKAEAEKAQAEAELARLRLEQARNGQYSRSYDRDDDDDSDDGSMDYRGFKIVSQLSPSYKNSVFGVGLNVDLGCVVADGLFVGAGPQASLTTFSGDTYFNGGLMATAHYAFPTGKIRPYIDGHWGYGFEFEEIENGYFSHNYSVGVQFGNGTFLGLFFDAQNSEYIPALKVGFGMPRTDGSKRAPRERKIVPTRNSGLELSVEGGVEACKYSLTYHDYTYEREPAIWNGSVTLGYRINSNFSAGIGYKCSIEGATYDETYNGMYARGQYRVFDKRFTPLVEMEFLYDFSDELYYIAPRIGCSFRTTNNSYITCKIEYRRNITHFSGYDESTMNALGIRIGWTHTFGWLSR